MQSKKEKDKLPSNKVGIVFIIVVLVVVGTIVSSKIKVPKPTIDLKSVELLVERKTDPNYKTGDTDSDGLSDWLEEFYKTDINNPDTDGDGTPDGEEVQLSRNPAVAGPDDKVITPEDYFTKDYASITFATNTVTSKMSIDLFGQYFDKKQDGVLTEEEKISLVQDVSQKVTGGFKLVDQFSASNITSVQAIGESVVAYGEALAQETTSLVLQLDQKRNLPETQYLLAIAQIYKDQAYALSKISVPTTFVEAHLEIVNNTFNTGALYAELAKPQDDSVTMLILLSKQKVIQESTQNLYKVLSQHFKNNGIIFSTDSSKTFWNNF